MFLAQTDPKSLVDWINSIGALQSGLILFALLMGWFITKREADAKDRQIAECKTERDEWKNLYLRRQGVVEDAVDLAKQRRP